MAGLFGNNAFDWFTRQPDPENLPGYTNRQMLGNTLQNVAASLSPLTRMSTPAAPDPRKQALQEMQLQAAQQQMAIKKAQANAFNRMRGTPAAAGQGAVGGTVPTVSGLGNLVSQAEMEAIARGSNTPQEWIERVDVLAKERIKMQAKGASRQLTDQEVQARGLDPEGIYEINPQQEVSRVGDKARQGVVPQPPASDFGPEYVPPAVEDQTPAPEKAAIERSIGLPLTDTEYAGLVNRPQAEQWKYVDELRKQKTKRRADLVKEFKKDASNYNVILEKGTRAMEILSKPEGALSGADINEALIAFAKVLDPNSVVRPGEAEMAKQAASQIDELRRRVKQLTESTGPLDEKTARLLLKQMIDMAQGAWRNKAALTEHYKDIFAQEALIPGGIRGPGVRPFVSGEKGNLAVMR